MPRPLRTSWDCGLHVPTLVRAGCGPRLRRTSYEVDEATGYSPEYVNIFGVPFTFLPHEGSADAPPPPPATGKTRIEPVAERRAQYEMTWPNVIRIDHEYRPQLTLDTDK